MRGRRRRGGREPDWAAGRGYSAGAWSAGCGRGLRAQASGAGFGRRQGRTVAERLLVVEVDKHHLDAAGVLVPHDAHALDLDALTVVKVLVHLRAGVPI